MYAYTHVADTSGPCSPLLCCPGMPADWAVTFRCEQWTLQKACQPTLGCLFWFEKICWRMQQGRRAVEKNLGGQHLKREASQKSQELCLRKADWSPWCQAMRLDRWAKFKKKFISNPEIMLEAEWTEIAHLEPCPCVLQGMHTLTFSFRRTLQNRGTMPAPGAEQQPPCAVPAWDLQWTSCGRGQKALALLLLRADIVVSSAAACRWAAACKLQGGFLCCLQHAAWAWGKQNQN